MTRKDQVPNLFRALLRYQRQSRGMSQLDLALAANTSSRHISFLETGRAQPSREMVLRLSASLGLSLRAVNELLETASLPRVYPEHDPSAPLPDSIERAIARMLEHHEPYPMVVFNRRYDVLRFNQGAVRLISRFLRDPAQLGDPPNLLHLTFHPELMRPFIEDWETLARGLLTRLQREALQHPTDRALAELSHALCAYPDVPADFAQPALDLPMTPTLEMCVNRDGQRARFFTTVTAFHAPLDVTLEELQLESFFPLDAETERLCREG